MAMRRGLWLLAALAALSFTNPARADPAGDPPIWDCNRIPTGHGEELSLFLNSFCHIEKGWAGDNKARVAGPVVDGVYYGAHGPIWAQVFYSPHVYTWMLEGRPKDTRLPSGSMIVKQQYAYDPDKVGPGPLEGWTVMLKDEEASHDGWIWAYIGYKDPQWDDSRPFLPYCVACHASADNRELTFSDLRRIVGVEEGTGWTPPWPFGTSGTSGTEPVVLPMPDDPGMHGAGHAAYESADDAEAAAPGRPTLAQPLEAPDGAFVELYGTARRVARSELKTFPPQSMDHVVPAAHDPQPFVTSGVCAGCHDADSLLGYKTPDMMTNIGGHNFNLSPYGEWSASPMGLAGRDPIFHAQAETERALHPELADVIDNTCFSCHGIMGRRQLTLDTQDQPGGPRLFTHDMVYAEPGHPDAKYGALARDGISCTICHRMAADGLGEPETYTSNFKIGPVDEIYGPYKEVAKYSMETALGFTPKFADQIKDPALCGSCHMVVLPALEVGREYSLEDLAAAPTHHEQTTFNEWRNSGYWDPDYADHSTTCQGCHMPRAVEDIPPFTPDNPLTLKYRVANIQDSTYPPFMNQAPDKDIKLTLRDEYSRHTFLGINQFVLQFYQQFHDILGVNPVSENINRREKAVEALALAGQAGLHMARAKTARLSITDVTKADGMLSVGVKVENLVGHKFPSGVGFRRAFLEFRVETGNGRVLWASGRPSPLGVILDGDGAPLETEFSRTTWQPHHDVITRRDQAQIYEERHLDTTGKLTTSFFSLAKKVKDTRLLPKGWGRESDRKVIPADYHEMIACEYDAATDDCAPMTDPYYLPGAGGGDELTYRVPLNKILGAAKVVVKLHYQAIPPYYLRDRFETGAGPETERLYYLASHLNVDGNGIDDWTIDVAEAERSLR